MKQRQIYIISLLFLLPISAVLAQEDSTQVIESKLGLYLSADYGKGVESLVSNQLKWEFGAGAIISNKIVVALEYGYGKLQPQGVINNGSYSSEGNYYRAGIEYMFEVAIKRYLSIGAMYGFSTFNDEGIVNIESELWPDLNEKFFRSDLQANWTEIILNSEGPISNAAEGFLGNFYWGIRFRLRILFSETKRSDFDIYAIPGYGKTYSNKVPSINLFVKYRFNL